MTILALLVALAGFDRISIDVGVGGLGGWERFTATYVRAGRWFEAKDGARIESQKVDAIARAVDDGKADFALERSAIDSSFLERSEGFFERAMLGMQASDASRAADFRARFTDYAALQKECRAQFDVPVIVTDYNPSLTLTLSSGTTTIATISGRSQREFFLPVHVTTQTGERISFDPAITARIAALLPEKAPLRSVMLGDDVAYVWAARAARQEWLEPVCRTIGHPYLPNRVDGPAPIPGT